MTTYHVRHRYGFIGSYDEDRIVNDLRDAVIYSKAGAFHRAEEINKYLGELDRKASVVMLTKTQKMRKVQK